MVAQLVGLAFGANDPARLARFWAGVLDRRTTEDFSLLAPDGPGFEIRFVPTDAPKVGPNQIHFDLTSTSLDDQQQTVSRALDLGGRHLDIGQRPEEGHVVLADPEGNEFCVIEPDNAFLAGTAVIGALSSDGSREVGHFWSRALEWPLVWDQDEETAIQSPIGGMKITWGGPPLNPRNGRNRLRLELAPADGDDHDAEVARLVELGATRIGPGTDRGSVELADPDGNELSVLTSR